MLTTKTYHSTTLTLKGSCQGTGSNMSKYDVRIKPVPEDTGRNPKYNCPICLAMGCKHRVIKSEYKPYCPICGVQFDWEI